MRTQNSRLASLVFLITSATANINLTGSGVVYPTNKTCNGTTGPTGVTGTSPGSTGTSPRSTKTSSRCVFTTSILSFIEFSETSTSDQTETDLGAGPFINGDTLTAVDGTATGFVTIISTSTIPETRTATIVAPGPLVTVGSTPTVTVPPPSGFLPVQSTLPNATFGYQNPCNISTVVVTTSVTFTRDLTSTSTMTGAMLQTNRTVIPLTQFTDFSVVIATSTSVTEVYLAETATTFFGDPFTVAPNTVTVYPACATNNFADAIVSDPTNPETINGYLAPGGIDAIRFDLGPNNFLDCCIEAFRAGADIWTFGYGFGCGYAFNRNGVCDPPNKNSTAIISDRLGAQNIVIGNAQCARLTAVEFQP